MEITKAQMLNVGCDECEEITLQAVFLNSSLDEDRTCMLCGRQYMNNEPVPLQAGRGGRDSNRKFAMRRYNAHKNK